MPASIASTAPADHRPAGLGGRQNKWIDRNWKSENIKLNPNMKTTLGKLLVFGVGMFLAVTTSAQSVTKIAAGGNHSLFLKSDGSLWATGYNQYGQLGDGTYNQTNRPERIIATNVMAIAAGGFHSLFLKNDGSLWAMGRNNGGQLGDGTYNNTSQPEQIVASNVTAIAAGGLHSLFLKNDGSLWGMGHNGFGQLGDGTLNNINRPEQIVASNVTAIAAGGIHSLFLKNDGSLWAMGNNQNGQLGDGTSNPMIKLPEQIMGSNITAIAAGGNQSQFLKSDGSLWAMGAYGAANTTNQPVQIVSSNVTAIAAGYYHNLSIQNDGSLWAMGWDISGQLGDGNPGFNSWVYSPEQIVTNGTTAIAAGNGHSLFLKNDGSLWGMGGNAYGELGDGTYDQINLPEQIIEGSPLPPVVADIAVMNVGPGSVVSGATYTNVITVTNAGPASATNVVVVDMLPGGGTTNLTVPVLAAGGMTNIYVVAVAPGSGPLTNMASAVATTPDPNLLNNTNAVVINVIMLLSETWTQSSASVGNWHSIASSADGSKLIAAVEHGGVYLSTNAGATWTQTLNGLPVGTAWISAASSADGTILGLVSFDSDGIYMSHDSGAHWAAASLPYETWFSIAASADGSKWVAAATYDGTHINPGPIYTSTNYGTSWISNTVPGQFWNGVASSADGKIFAAVCGNYPGTFGPIYTSTNYGFTWVSNNVPVELWHAVAVSADGKKSMAVALNGPIYVSTNSGTTWTSANSPSPTNWLAVAASADGSRFTASVFGGGIYTTTNMGSSWLVDTSSNLNWAGLAMSADGYRLASVNFGGGIYTTYTPPSPKLKIVSWTNNFTFMWTVPSTNLVLQQSSDLTSWTNVTNPPVLNCTNLQNQVTLPTCGNCGFYRLKTP